MSTMKVIRAPAPNGSDSKTDRLFLFKMPRSRLLGAVDSKRRAVDVRKHGDGDADVPDLGELHVMLDEMLSKVLSEGELESARAELDRVLRGAAREYDDGHGEDEDDDQHDGEGTEVEGRGRSRARQFLAERGVSDSETDELFGMLNGMPKNGREGGMGGRLHAEEARDRRRLAGDRRRQIAADERAADAESSFAKMFPGAARIGNAY